MRRCRITGGVDADIAQKLFGQKRHEGYMVDAPIGTTKEHVRLQTHIASLAASISKPNVPFNAASFRFAHDYAPLVRAMPTLNHVGIDFSRTAGEPVNFIR